MNVPSKKTLLETQAALEAQLAALQSENAKLREAHGRRPSDALVISTNLVFQKGTHQDLVGKRVKLSVPQEALGALHISCVAKKNSRGNVYLWATGWVDTSKLDLSSATSEAEVADKATKSFKDEVVGS